MEKMEDRGLRREEVLQLLGVSVATFYRLIREGRLEAYRVRCAYRVRLSEVERFRRERVV